MSSSNNNLVDLDLSEIPSAKNLKFGITVSKWNSEITNSLLNGCLDLLHSKGVDKNDIEVLYVPGSFELVYGSKYLQNKNFICNATSQGIKDLNISGNCPVIFCVLTDDNIQQSIDRSGGKYGNKGTEAAIAAIEMALI